MITVKQDVRIALVLKTLEQGDLNLVQSKAELENSIDHVNLPPASRPGLATSTSEAADSTISTPKDSHKLAQITNLNHKAPLAHFARSRTLSSSPWMPHKRQRLPMGED